MVTRRWLLRAAAAGASASATGCLSDDGGVVGSLVVYAVPDPPEGVEAIDVDDVGVRAVEVTVKQAPVYKGRDVSEVGLDATSTPIESETVYQEIVDFLESTPSVEAGDPYPQGGTVVRFEDDYFLVDVRR